MHPHGRGPSRRWILGGALAIAVLAGLLFALAVIRPAAAPPPPSSPEVSERLTARGQVRPARQARVGTLQGGVIRELVVAVGDLVDEQHEIARIRGPEGTEVLVAPFRGTVGDILVNVGDTVVPGTVVATVGDLSRLQVETTDVDEFIVSSIHPGQPVSVLIESLDRKQLPGTVRTVALAPRTASAGDEHYPVVIDLPSTPPELRAGMTARITFSP